MLRARNGYFKDLTQAESIKMTMSVHKTYSLYAFALVVAFYIINYLTIEISYVPRPFNNVQKIEVLQAEKDEALLKLQRNEISIKEFLELDARYNDDIKANIDTRRDVFRQHINFLYIKKLIAIILFFISAFTIILIMFQRIYYITADAYKKGLTQKKIVSSALSHDFKSMIALALDLAQENTVKNKDSIIAQLQDLQNAINDFSEFNKIDRPDIEKMIKDRQELIDINTYLTNYYVGLDIKHIVPHNAAIVDEIDDKKVFIKASKDSINSVLNNIFSNIRKYAEGCQHIYIGTSMIDKDHIRIRIGDDGIGINGDLKYRIFDPYVKNTNSDVKKYDIFEDNSVSSGLGLYNAKRNIELNNGTMTIVDTQKGLVFEMIFKAYVEVI